MYCGVLWVILMYGCTVVIIIVIRRISQTRQGYEADIVQCYGCFFIVVVVVYIGSSGMMMVVGALAMLQ